MSLLSFDMILRGHHMYVIDPKDLQVLFTVLRGRGYSLVGPTVRDGAIVYDSIVSTDNLPKGWTDEQQPASYSIEHTGGEAYFNFVVGPHSWKKFLYPPRHQLFSATRTGKGFEVSSHNGDQPRYAFIGVRSCEIQAIAVQDKVFAEGEYADPMYMNRRQGIFIVAVNCVKPGGNCFCVSMDTGPKAKTGFDLALTEVYEEGKHYFVVEAGSEQGNRVLSEVPHRTAESVENDRAVNALREASGQMGKSLNTQNITQVLNDNFEHHEWDDVSKRCLACTNCTMVCPTCFCSTVEDVTDLSGDHAERWRRWDSCFTSDFTKIAGGNIRMSTRSRYRQWMMHKLGHWIDQFGTSGCVGCGRCITWCPVGIDITAEARVIRETSTAKSVG